MDSTFNVLAPILLEKMVDKLFLKLNNYSEGINKRKLKVLLKRIIDNNDKITKVKTLWNYDSPVDLNEFYVSPKIFVHHKRKEIHNIEDKDFDDNVLIQGMAGQGKSILLRKLCSVESSRGVYVPVFFELRKLKDGVLKNILEYLNFNGWNNVLEDSVKYDHVYASVNFAFFLDGLDEVPSCHMNAIVNEIDELAGRYKKHRFIVSSRYNSGLEYSSNFCVVNIDNLDIDKNEHVPILTKISDDIELTTHIVREINQCNDTIKGLLITPLYVTLLFINFKSQRGMPSAITEFYNELFGVLLKRHDNAKISFVRERLVSVGDLDFRKIFNGFCFASKEYSNTNEFNKYNLVNSIDASKKYYGLEFESSDYLNDVVSITSLIINEGELYQFIHKSIQEFFSCSFICSSPERLKEKFYKICLRDQSRKWRQELSFLVTEDSYAYTKYFLTPLVEEFLNTKIDKIDRILKNPTGEIFKEIFCDNVFIFTYVEMAPSKSSLSIKNNLVVKLGNNNIEKFINIMEIFYTLNLEKASREISSAIAMHPNRFQAIDERRKQGHTYYSFRLHELCKFKEFDREIRKMDYLIVTRMKDEIASMRNFCRGLESFPLELDIDSGGALNSYIK